jgi:transposase
MIALCQEVWILAVATGETGRTRDMEDGSGGASALLGMDGFVVLSMEEHDDEWWLLVETTTDVAGCPTCGVRATGHGRSGRPVRDLPIAGTAVRLIRRKRRWRCTDWDCPRSSFTEQHRFVEGPLTSRVRAEISAGRWAKRVAAWRR